MIGVFRNVVRKNAVLSRTNATAAFSTSNYTVVKNFEQYMTAVKSQEEDKLVVAFFNAKFSTYGKVLAPQFAEMAKSYPQHTFLAVDVDEVPRAAYHADVVDPTAVVVMNRDDAFRANIGPEDHANFTTIITRAKNAIDTFKYDEKVTGQSSWDHHIRRDNLHAVDQGIHILPTQ